MPSSTHNDAHHNKPGHYYHEKEEEELDLSHVLIVHSDHPRRPKSAFNVFFAMERRRLLQQQHLAANGRTIRFADTIATITQTWKTLSTVDKEPFRMLAQQDKIRYEQEMQAYYHHGQHHYETPSLHKTREARNAKAGQSYDCSYYLF